MQTLVQIFIGFVVFFVLFATIEKLFPARSKKIVRQGYFPDLIYWVMAPTVNTVIKKIMIFLALVPVALITGASMDAGLLEGYGPVARQPPVWIMVELLLVGDFITYWLHRGFHGRHLWRIHAIHHSSTDLDWLSSVRGHPFNQGINAAVSVAVLVALGFPLRLAATYMPFILFYGVLLHANLPWSFGPLRFLIASPCFHRWHHGCEQQCLNKNFAGLFPVFDLMFGTFYMPVGRQPEKFGVNDETMPDGVLGQLLYPFRRGPGSGQ